MKRSFDVDALQVSDDGKTVQGRIVPYNEVATIMERRGSEVVTYKEQFLPGSCTRIEQRANKRGNAGFIAFLLEHEEREFSARIGYAKTVWQEDDGAYATFGLYDGGDLDKVRSMLQTSHTGLSVSFGDAAAPKQIDGIVSRTQVEIGHVAATPIPCYAGAGITEIRDLSTIEIVNDATPNLDDVRRWLEEMAR